MDFCKLVSCRAVSLPTLNSSDRHADKKYHIQIGVKPIDIQSFRIPIEDNWPETQLDSWWLNLLNLCNPRESYSFEKINPIEALWNWSPSSYKPHPPKHTYNNTYTNIHHHILNIFRFRVNLSKAWSMIVRQPELRFELANKTTYALSLGYVAHWWPLTKTWLLARLEVVSSLQTSHPGAIEQPGGWAKLERLGRQACLETGDLELMVLGKSVQPHEWWMWCYRKYMQWVCSFYKTSIAKSLC